MGLQVLLDEVLDDGQRERDAAPSDHHDDAGVGGVYGVAGAAVRALDHDGHVLPDIDAVRDARLDVPALLGHIVELPRPPAGAFANEDEALLADGAALFARNDGRAGDGEGV